MSETTLDRVPIGQAQAESGISRSAFYHRLKQAGIIPLKVGVSSFLTSDHLDRLRQIEAWIQEGNKPEDFLASIGEVPSAGAAGTSLPSAGQLAAIARQLPVLAEEPEEPGGQAPHELVLAELDLLERLLPFLTRAAEQGWALPSSQVELLVGGRPGGEGFDRFGFRFVPAGKHGNEKAWRVALTEAGRKHVELMGFD